MWSLSIIFIPLSAAELEIGEMLRTPKFLTEFFFAEYPRNPCVDALRIQKKYLAWGKGEEGGEEILAGGRTDGQTNPSTFL